MLKMVDFPAHVDGVVDSLAHLRHTAVAWPMFAGMILDIAANIATKDALEIGGGRAPAINPHQFSAIGTQLTVNDISADELEHAPASAKRARFDISTRDGSEIEEHAEGFDLAYSKMVMEHVADFRQAYRNIATLLRPGGVSVAFHPAPYVLPFILNRGLPESVSGVALRAAFPSRYQGNSKFPAFYAGCAVSSRVRRNIAACGFRRVWQIPLFGHSYYERIAPLHRLQCAKAAIADRADLDLLAAYAITIACK